ncbi:MAG: type I-E CRISPR-associated protein Cas6/Cse3/CasE [Thermoguttaceae bacterium]|nr:type I-E CRISPR-associated protein Cas6/Cse3/CasE [Thermoguttaceae bacterium]
MFLTRVLVGRGDEIKLGLKDRYDWHQAIWRAFPGYERGTEQPFLWRLDVGDVASTLWILSEAEPATLGWGRQATKPVAETFLKHARYEFALSANPTVMRVVRLEDGSRKKNGSRTAIYDAAELKEWLTRKGEAGGFRVEQVDFDPAVKESFYKEKTKRGTLSRVEFRGVLSPTNFELFEATWKNGIGSAKGLGFGLLLLKPLA